MHICGFACLYVCVLHAYLVPVEDRRGHEILWNCSYRQLWVSFPHCKNRMDRVLQARTLSVFLLQGNYSLCRVSLGYGHPKKMGTGSCVTRMLFWHMRESLIYYSLFRYHLRAMSFGKPSLVPKTEPDLPCTSQSTLHFFLTFIIPITTSCLSHLTGSTRRPGARAPVCLLFSLVCLVATLQENSG